MSPIFIIAMVIVWIVVSQAKKAARQGMSSGAKALGRKAHSSARRRIESYRENVRSRRAGVEGRIEEAADEFEGRVERAAEELEDRWSRAEELLGSRIEEGVEEVGTSPLTVPEEIPPARELPPELPPEPPAEPPELPRPKLTPYETRAAGRATAAAAAATAAAAAAELARIEAEPDPIPSDDELSASIEADLTIGALETDLFESGRPGFEIEERFREEFGGRRVRWRGLLDRAETNLAGDRVEIIVQEVDDDPLSRPLRWTFVLDRADAEDLISKRQIPLAIEGTLDGCDPYLRQVTLVNARREAEPEGPPA